MIKAKAWLAIVALALSLTAIAQVEAAPLVDPGSSLRSTNIFDHQVIDNSWQMFGYQLAIPGRYRFRSELWLDGKKIGEGVTSSSDQKIYYVIGWQESANRHCRLKIGHWQWSENGGGSGTSCDAAAPKGEIWSEYLLPSQVEMNRPYLAFWMRWTDDDGNKHHLIQVITINGVD